MSIEFLQRSLSSKVPTVVGAFLLLNFCAWLILVVSRKWTSSKAIRSPTPDLEKPASRPGAKGKVTREWGGEYPSPKQEQDQANEICSEWPPSDFKRPKAAPYPDWDVHTTKPIPYRPFRYGP